MPDRRDRRRLGKLAILAVVAAAILGNASIARSTRLDADVIGTRPLIEVEPDVRSAAPDVDLPAGILVTREGQVLWERDADDVRPMASTTKIMTCLIALEETVEDEVVTVSRQAAGVGGSGVYLRGGEELTARELELALMLESSNAAAAALAEHIAGTEAAFVETMNERAAELGLSETSFENPHGLDAAGHHTSARDLASLAVVAMRIREFREIVKAREATISGPYGQRQLENGNDLLGEYDGADGIKTGWTDSAGYCLVASAERDGVSLIAVVLGTRSSEARFAEGRRLLDWGFEHFGPVGVASAEETIASVPVSDYLDRRVVACVSESATVAILDADGPVWREYEVAGMVGSPVEAGDPLGVLRAYQGDRLLAEVPLVAGESVPEPGLWERIRVFVVRVWNRWFGAPHRESAMVQMRALG